MSSEIYIGSDFIPTKTNYHLFCQGRLEELIGQNLSEMLSHATLNIFNLELPLTKARNPIQKSGPSLSAPPEVINLYKKISAPLCLTLANNHILDQGELGVLQTLSILSKEKIYTVGAGQNLKEAQRSIRFFINGSYIGLYACAENECTIAGRYSAGANPFDPLESYDAVARLKKECNYVIVCYHGGAERYRYPSPNLQRYCRKFVEKGADLVVCQHSHCIGCRENYKNGVIVYGQGNFVFDIDNDEFFRTGLLLRITISDTFHVEEIPIEKVGNGIRIATGDVKEEIMSSYYNRSKEIQQPGFIESNYEKFASEWIKYYLSIYYQNHLDVFLQSLPNQIYTVMLNNIRCEAHHELFSTGLKLLSNR